MRPQCVAAGIALAVCVPVARAHEPSGRDAYRQDFDDVRTNLPAIVPGSAGSSAAPWSHAAGA